MKEYSLADIIKLDLKLEIAKLVKIFGIQGTEDKIYEVYTTKQMEVCKRKFLETLYEQYPFYKFRRK